HSPGRDPLPRALALLTVHPRVVRGAQRILGPRVCLAASSMTFKHPSGGPPVPRHRDTFINKLPGPQQHIVLNIDICIDAATVETGCLWMASGTHQLLDVEEIAARDPGDWSDMVPVEGQPGDIVFHNDLTVHGSPATAPHDGSKWRRIALSVYVDPDGLHQHGFVSGMSGVPAWDVLALMDLMQDIVNLRQTVHGDVDYVIPPWTPPAGSPTEPPEQPPLLPCGTCVD
ncbi:MAG: phytanoyl-CoA dioxygenase family protein, partial [Propionibacteriaceae bacterium]|nr:phytanoyl-CoA dioxygenase family protein [Propionibacteriaceae bacterium]